MKDSMFGGKRIELGFDSEGSKERGGEGLINEEQWNAHVDAVGECANKIVDAIEDYPAHVAMDAVELVLKSGAKMMGDGAQDLLIRHLEEFHAELTIVTLMDVLKRRVKSDEGNKSEVEGSEPPRS